MAKAKEDKLGTKLEAAVASMLEQVNAKDKDGASLDMELRLKVFDRALKYWAVKNKWGDSGEGSAWYDKPQPEGEE